MPRMVRCLIALVALAALGPVSAEQRFITVGTGGVTGVYYPAGGAICRLVNKDTDEHGFRCSVVSTGGSVYNINTLRRGGLDLGIAQSDWQYHAHRGTSRFADDGPFEGLRAVFSLHPEPLTIVARADSGIRELADLKGKRVNLGNPGSGQRATMETVMDAVGWTSDDFGTIAELKANEMASALCDNKIDAFVYVVGHPAGAIQKATTTCDARLVDVASDPIRDLVADRPYYAMAAIPGGMYQGNPEPTTTFGVRATLVSSTDVSADAVAALVSAVFENFNDFRGLHPAFEVLDRQSMTGEALSIPLHEGAKRYYRANGLID
jgi:TRAP transporter TAXI family solute receptor